MGASADSGASDSPRPDGERTWVEASLGRDIAGVLIWDLAFLSLLWLALVDLQFGESGLRTYLWTFPVVLVLVVPLTLFLMFMASTARRVGAGGDGLAIVRFRRVEEYSWSGVKPGFRPPRTWPLLGHRYPVTLSAEARPRPEPVNLTRTQAELVASHFGKTVEETWLPRKLAKRRE